MKSKRPIYLDYAATTPVDDRVREAMCRALTYDGIFGNASSVQHEYGKAAEEAIENARATIATLLSCRPREIIFTSGATEANNLALQGVARGLSDKGRHIITSAIEHKSVLATCEALSHEGFEVTRVLPNGNGRIDVQSIADEIRDDTILISVMHVNNETGVIQDIHALAEAASERGIFLHVDAAQSAGKIPIDLSDLRLDAMSISAHKIYGPKGAGVLFLREDAAKKVDPIIFGGGQERGLRPGTLPTHQIIGMAEAFSLAHRLMASDHRHLDALRQQLLGLLQEVGGMHINSGNSPCVPNILNVSFDGIDAEALLMNALDIAISTISACSTGTVEPSYVLRAMRLDDERVYGAIRISMGRYTTPNEIDYVASRLKEVVQKIRQLTSVNLA